MSQTIEMLIQPDGQSTIQTKGILGNQCRQASRFLEQALGQTAAETLTDEFYLSQPHQEHERQRTQ
jgi:Protein of unknown function (DUF2997)